MKKFLVTYVIFSVIILILVYLVTLIQETQKRSNALYFEILNTSLEARDLDDFIKYQSIGFKRDQIFETSDFEVHLYHVIEQENDRYYFSFNMFLIPNENVKHATNINDSNDQTGIEIINSVNDQVLYLSSNDPAYDQIAISYGIEVLGYYYYKFIWDESYVLDVSLYDYDGDFILNETLTYTHLTYDGNQLPEGFQMGNTIEEIIEMQNMTHYLIEPMLINIGLYLVVDVSMGVLFYWFLNKKKL